MMTQPRLRPERLAAWASAAQAGIIALARSAGGSQRLRSRDDRVGWADAVLLRWLRRLASGAGGGRAPAAARPGDRADGVGDGGIADSEPGLRGATPIDNEAELDGQEEAAARAAAEEGARLARDHGWDAEPRLAMARSTTWRAIVEVADELDASLVVCGTRGLSRVRGLVLLT
jgi:nucleotide-binding universal stress UspA family protein